MIKRRCNHDCSVVNLGALGTVVLMVDGIKQELDSPGTTQAATYMEYAPLDMVRMSISQRKSFLSPPKPTVLQGPLPRRLTQLGPPRHLHPPRRRRQRPRRLPSLQQRRRRQRPLRLLEQPQDHGHGRGRLLPDGACRRGRPHAHGQRGQLQVQGDCDGGHVFLFLCPVKG